MYLHTYQYAPLNLPLTFFVTFIDILDYAKSTSGQVADRYQWEKLSPRNTPEPSSLSLDPLRSVLGVVTYLLHRTLWLPISYIVTFYFAPI